MPRAVFGARGSGCGEDNAVAGFCDRFAGLLRCGIVPGRCAAERTEFQQGLFGPDSRFRGQGSWTPDLRRQGFGKGLRCPGKTAGRLVRICEFLRGGSRKKRQKCLTYGNVSHKIIKVMLAVFGAPCRGPLFYMLKGGTGYVRKCYDS